MERNNQDGREFINGLIRIVKEADIDEKYLADKGIDLGEPRNAGTMQKAHFPEQPSCTFRYARDSWRFTGIIEFGSVGGSKCAGMGFAFGWHPIMRTSALGNRLESCWIFFSQSFCAFAVTEQHLTITTSGLTESSSAVCGRWTVSCPAAVYCDSRSRVSALFNLHPNV